MPSLAASHSVGRTDPPMNSMVQTGQVIMSVIIYERSNIYIYQGCNNTTCHNYTPVGREVVGK